LIVRDQDSKLLGVFHSVLRLRIGARPGRNLALLRT
jgi:hypothetical protein